MSLTRNQKAEVVRHVHARGLSHAPRTPKRSVKHDRNAQTDARSSEVGYARGSTRDANANEARLTVGEATGVIPLEAAAGGRRLTFFFQGEINKADEFHRDVSQVHR